MDRYNYVEIWKQVKQEELDISSIKLNNIQTTIEDELDIYYSVLSKDKILKIKSDKYIRELKNELELIELTDDEKIVVDYLIKNKLIDHIKVDYGMFNEISFYQ